MGFLIYIYIIKYIHIYIYIIYIMNKKDPFFSSYGGTGIKDTTQHCGGCSWAGAPRALCSETLVAQWYP